MRMTRLSWKARIFSLRSSGRIPAASRAWRAASIRSRLPVISDLRATTSVRTSRATGAFWSRWEWTISGMSAGVTWKYRDRNVGGESASVDFSAKGVNHPGGAAGRAAGKAFGLLLVAGEDMESKGLHFGARLSNCALVVTKPGVVLGSLCSEIFARHSGYWAGTLFLR